MLNSVQDTVNVYMQKRLMPHICSDHVVKQ